MIGHDSTVNWVYWSPTGERILTASMADGIAKVWDPGTGAELLIIDKAPWAVWSPSGERILASDGLSLRVYDTATGDELLATDNKGSVCGIAWSPFGDRILTGLADGSASVWDATTGEEQFTLRGHTAGLGGWGEDHCVGWSPDGNQILTWSFDGSAMLWDAKPTFQLTGHQAAVWDVKWSPSGDRILTSSTDGTARLWDAASASELMSLEISPDGVFVDWSPSGDRFVTSGFGKAQVYEADKGTSLVDLAVPNEEGGFLQPWLSIWSSDGKYIATLHELNPFVWLWDATSGKELGKLEGHERSLYFIDWSPNGDWLVSTDQAGIIKVWDANTQHELYTLNAFDAGVNIIKYSEDGDRIAAYSYDGTGKIFDAETGKTLLEFSGHTGNVWAMDWSPSGERLATGSEDGTLRVWDTTNGLEILHYPIGSLVQWIDWSGDGKEILIAYENKVIKLPIWSTKQELIEYAYKCCMVRDLSPEDRELYGIPTDE